MSKIVAFLPMRKGSQRVKNKNIKNFSDIDGGLTFIKITQLLKVKQIDKIIVSTNDEEVKKIAKSFKNAKIVIDNRPENLASSSTSTDDLIKYVPKIIQDNNVILWTHVTSPFVDEKIYEEMIKKYFEEKNKYDSLLSVNKLQTFLWDNKEPINYNREIEKWPRTQTIEPLYEVNSAAFIADIQIYKNLNDRIGKKPYLYELDKIKSFDIDWEEDFEIAEILWRKYGKI